MAAFDKVIDRAKLRHSLRGQQSPRDAPKFAEGLDAHQYDTRLSLSGAIPTTYNRTAQLDSVANFRQQVQDAERARLENERAKAQGLPPPHSDKMTAPVSANPFAAERGVLSQRRRNGKIEEARVDAQNEFLESEGEPLKERPGNIRASFNQFYRADDSPLAGILPGIEGDKGFRGRALQYGLGGSSSVSPAGSVVKPSDYQDQIGKFGPQGLQGAADAQRAQRMTHQADPNARYLQPGEVDPGAGPGAGPLPSMEGLSLREKVKQGIELTNADAKPFTGNTYDGKAVSKGYDDVLAVHAKYNALDDAREQRGTLNALRQRVARGGFGSKQAGETLRGLMEAQASQDTASGKGGASAFEAAKFDQNERKFIYQQQNDAENRSVGALDNYLKQQGGVENMDFGSDGGGSARGFLQFANELQPTNSSEAAAARALYQGLVGANEDAGFAFKDRYSEVTSLSQFKNFNVDKKTGELTWEDPSGNTVRTSYDSIFDSGLDGDAVNALLARMQQLNR